MPFSTAVHRDGNVLKSWSGLPVFLGHRTRRSAAKNSGRGGARGVKKAAFQHGFCGSLSQSSGGPTPWGDRLKTTEPYRTVHWATLFATGGVFGDVNDIDANGPIPGTAKKWLPSQGKRSPVKGAWSETRWT